jgi:hypothetical protein
MKERKNRNKTDGTGRVGQVRRSVDENLIDIGHSLVFLHAVNGVDVSPPELDRGSALELNLKG